MDDAGPLGPGSHRLGKQLPTGLRGQLLSVLDLPHLGFSSRTQAVTPVRIRVTTAKTTWPTPIRGWQDCTSPASLPAR
jgi:hypothetical protein